MILFVEYPKCSTCQKAKKWLEEHNIVFEDRHIVEQNPTAEELKSWAARSGLELKRFFNTSGLMMLDGKRVLFSGMQATGNLTLGNYLGALKNWVNISDE